MAAEAAEEGMKESLTLLIQIRIGQKVALHTNYYSLAFMFLR